MGDEAAPVWGEPYPCKGPLDAGLSVFRLHPEVDLDPLDPQRSKADPVGLQQVAGRRGGHPLSVREGAEQLRHRGPGVHARARVP